MPIYIRRKPKPPPNPCGTGLTAMEHHTNALSSITIKRRFLKFLRHHKITFGLDNGNIIMGSGICTIVNGQLCMYFPRIGHHYGNHANFKIDWDDPYNVYIKLSRMHNRLIAAFPMARVASLPDMFD